MAEVPLIECCVYGCNNSTLTTDDSAIQYYFFPNNPVIAQSWIDSTIWKSATLDLNTARVCSSHFDADSYSNEYKKSDYLNLYYTKVLKFDAVPTQNLPNYEAIPEAPFQSTDPSTSANIKPIIVFNLTETEPFTSYETAGIIESNSNTEISNIKFIEPSTFDEPVVCKQNLDVYERINNYNDYVELQNENSLLVHNIAQLKERIAHLKEVCAQKSLVLNEKLEDIDSAKRRYNSLIHSTYSMQEKKKILSKVLSESQIKILCGKKKIYWSDDDMAVGHTIRHMSSKRCYMYLSKTLNFPLPALSSLKRWATSKKGKNEAEKNEESD